MEVANVELLRTKTRHEFAYFDHVLGGVGVDFDIYFTRRDSKEKTDSKEKLVGFKVTPPKTTMKNGKPVEDRRRDLDAVDGFLSLCDKTGIPVEIQIGKITANSEDINSKAKFIQVEDDELPRDRLTINKFNNQMVHSSEVAFFGFYEGRDHKEFRYRVHIRAAVIIPDVVEQIKALRKS